MTSIIENGAGTKTIHQSDGLATTEFQTVDKGGSFILLNRRLETISEYPSIFDTENPLKPVALITKLENGSHLVKKDSFILIGNEAFHRLKLENIGVIVNTIKQSAVKTDDGDIETIDGLQTKLIQSWEAEITCGVENQERTYLASLSQIQQESGLILNIQDITEEKLRQALMERDKMVSQLRSGLREQQDFDNTKGTLAHELRNPVAAINGYAQLIKREIRVHSGDLGNIGTYAEKIHSSTNDLIEIIHMMLEEVDMSREAVLQQISTSTLFRIATNNAERLQTDNTTIAIYSQEDEIHLMIDVRKIWLALQNYINNAKQAGANLITVTGDRVDENYYSISVQDNGSGMTPEELKECERRGYSNIQKNSSGLGLEIAHNSIKDCGGKLLPIESKVGKGTTFSFTLPICKKQD